MNPQPNEPNLAATLVVAPPATMDRDLVDERARKRTLVMPPQPSSAKANGTPRDFLPHAPTDPGTDRKDQGLIDFRRRRQQRDDALPEVGDALFGFRLLHELGRGTFARVFLASQEELASRPVVLKVSNIEGDEPQTMALLQHTHIVPIYSIHEEKQVGLRAVCMPYFGGASLSAVLKETGVGSTPVHRGEDLVRALLAVQAAPPTADGSESSADKSPAADPKVLSLLKSLTYAQAAAWIVARLAEGLHHSHGRGVLHRDVKPSNILLGSDGMPLLLDFNLAQVTRGDKVKVVLGGTLNYMAPEHLRSLAARDHVMGRQVNHRADIYSLGMVLFEMLVGRGPFAESATSTPLPELVEAMAIERGRAAPSLRQALPDAPWNLESIIHKCLAPDPAKRYQTAEQLAEDLQRFLDDRPLRYAPELSLRERGRKWRRRHPRLAVAASVASVAAMLLLTLGTALAGTQHLLATTQSQLDLTKENLDRANALELKRAFHAGAIRALCLVNTTVAGQDHLESGRAECEQTLGLYQILTRDDWQEQSAWRHLTPTDRQTLAEDARELLLLLAWTRASAGPKDPAALREALSLLQRAEAVSGLAPLRALWEDRALYWNCLGEAERAKTSSALAANIRPQTARDYYLLAISFARNGRYADAVKELDASLQINPSHYWSLVQRGICYREQGELLLAAGDFSRCAGLEPNFAWGHYNLGCILDQNQKHEQAIACYNTALRCDSNFALAYLNRGLAFLDCKQFRTALSDLDTAAGLGREDALLHLGRGDALEELKQFILADEAFDRAHAKIEALPPARQAPLLLRFGFAVSKRLPNASEAAFAKVLRQQPHHPQALYGKAMLLVDRQQESDAIACFNEALEWHPTCVDARRFRAVLLARQGKFTEAQNDINHCIQHEPLAGITLYAAACVLAQAAAKTPAPEARRHLENQAIGFLRKALDQGYGAEGAHADPDLGALQHRPEFQAMLLSKRMTNARDM
jgi:serine/threonine protein kinase/lipoprotein NlpI